MVRFIRIVLSLYCFTAVNKHVERGDCHVRRNEKKSRQTERELTTALFLLRCYQNNIPIDDLDKLDIGFIFDMFAEAQNDHYEWDEVATQNDFDRF